MKANNLILLIEDDAVDVMAMQRAFKDLKIANPLAVAGNGEEGVAYLRDGQNEKPGLILLDLNMPKMNGLEFLKIIKHDDELRRIPVVVLTTSKHEEDRIESFNLGVAGYIIKPIDYQQFMETIKTIGNYWYLSESAL